VRFAVIVGDPQPASPALAVATAAADALTRRIGLTDRYEVIDLSTLSRQLLLPEPSAAIEDAISVTLGADLLLVVSPVAAGTYSGLLKVFLPAAGTGRARRDYPGARPRGRPGRPGRAR
jgi:FMN reductase